jgi:hypothetical protein
MITESYAKERLGLTDKEIQKLSVWHKKVTGNREYFGAIGGELIFSVNSHFHR